METSPKKLLPLIFFAIAVTSLFSVQPAQAYTVTLQQVGANVVATGSGAINLTGLTGVGLFSPGSADLGANVGYIQTGVHGPLDGYQGFSGPTSFGSGGFFTANLYSGNCVDIWGEPFTYGAPTLWVPTGYTSGGLLSDSMTFTGATFASLGLTPGTYVWTWGTGDLPNQNFTLEIGNVPDGGTTVCLLGFALLCLVGLRRSLAC
jgi:hypothetical protein